MSKANIYFLDMFVYFQHVFLCVLVLSSFNLKFFQFPVHNTNLSFKFLIFDFAFLQSFSYWFCDILNQLHNLAHPHKLFSSGLQGTVLFSLIRFSKWLEALQGWLILWLGLQMLKLKLFFLFSFFLFDRFEPLFKPFIQFRACSELSEGFFQLLIMILGRWVCVSQRGFNFLLNFLLMLLFLFHFLLHFFSFIITLFRTFLFLKKFAIFFYICEVNRRLLTLWWICQL